jgi:ABC-type transporter Mla subunit MlaD
MPESASFSVRQRPNYRRRRTFTVLFLLVAAVVVIALLSRGGGGGGDNPIAQVAFVAKQSVVNQGKAADRPTRKSEGDAIVKMFDDYYQTAFVDPDKWGDGKFEDLRDLFAESVRASFTKDLSSLTIGEGRLDLKRVDPTTQKLAVTVYYNNASKPTLAVAAATFNATGTLKKAGPKVFIKQKATFYLQKTGDSWTITAYDADQTQETPPSPSPSPSAS